jgi:tetratricopeptide (TPR) repeat protein
MKILSVLLIIVIITLTIFGCQEKTVPEIPLPAIPPETSALTGEETETAGEVQEEERLPAEAPVPNTPVKPAVSVQPSRSLRDLSLSLPGFGVNIGELNPINYQKADPAVLRQMGMEPYLISFIVAENLYREGSYRDAIAEYNRSISLKPDADVLEGRGNAWLKSGDTGRAIEDYTRAINLKANRAELYNYRGYVYAERGETEKAIADFSQALILKPGYADALANRSRAYYRMGDYTKTIDDCTRLIALEPENFNAWNRRGSAWYSLRDDDRAIADFTRAITLKPDFALALHNRGNAWHSKGELINALADLDSAIAIDPGYAAARVSREYIVSQYN